MYVYEHTVGLQWAGKIQTVFLRKMCGRLHVRHALTFPAALSQMSVRQIGLFSHVCDTVIKKLNPRNDLPQS